MIWILQRPLLALQLQSSRCLFLSLSLSLFSDILRAAVQLIYRPANKKWVLNKRICFEIPEVSLPLSRAGRSSDNTTAKYCDKTRLTLPNGKDKWFLFCLDIQ